MTKTDIQTLPIPLVAMADCGAILGRRGAGKSGTGRVLLEHELDAGHRCCVIDPKGDWYGIRLTKDAKASRFHIPVFGGAHADCPIDDTMGAALGQIIAKSKDSCVIDLSGFSVAGMRRFMAAFAEALFFHNTNPLTLFVDEADQLAPQRVAADQARLLHNMEMLIRQGRQRGIFMWMLTQRPAVINKNLLSQAETLIAMKMTGPQDRKAIRDWMDAHDPEMAAAVDKDLSKLVVGQAWAWVPGADFLEKVQFPLFESYDSGRTPQHGEQVGSVELAPIDISELAKLLRGDGEEESDELAAALIEVSRLRARNAALTERNRELEVHRDAVVETLTAIQDRIGFVIGSPKIHPAPAGTEFETVLMVLEQDGEVRPMDAIGVRSARVRNGVRQIFTGDTAKADRISPEEAMSRGEQALAKIGKAATTVLDHLQPAQQRIVQAIASAAGAPLTRDEIARLAGISPTSSNVQIKLTRLDGNGLVEHVNGDMFRFVGHRQ